MNKRLRTNPSVKIFSVKHVPFLDKVYIKAGFSANPLSKYAGLLFFLIMQRLYPGKIYGTFAYRKDNTEKNIKYNAKNTQFESIYHPFFKNGYEPEVTYLLRHLVSEKSVFYDIGSNWGYFSLVAAATDHFHGQVYAFEPFPSTFRDLTEIVSQAGLEQIIHPFPIALSDHNGKSSMQFEGVLHSGFAYLNSNNQSSTVVPKALVSVRKLDSLELEKPTIIKIDAQYHEENIIKGAVNTLRSAYPAVIMENCLDFNKPSNSLAPLQLLEDLGYEFFFPCWSIKHNKQSQFPSEADKGNFVSKNFQLVPFNVSDRFLYRDMINILAYPKKQRKQLQEVFGIDIK